MQKQQTMNYTRKNPVYIEHHTVIRGVNKSVKSVYLAEVSVTGYLHDSLVNVVSLFMSPL